MDNNRAPHILNTSANLLGICFLILTSIQVLNVAAKTIIDSIIAIAIVLFTTSCFLSFIAMRKGNGVSERYEKIADYIFLSGLAVLFITTMLLVLNIIQ